MAGVAAMMLDANPALSPAGVRSILHQTADVHPDMERSAPDLSAKWDHRYGYGMVDAGAAVRMARSWPGLELGRDTDADGVRNPVDAGPRDPSVQEVEVPANLTPAGRQADTDGDGQVDGRDPHPLDPRRPGNTAALEGGSTGTGVGRPAASANSAPSPGAAAAVAVLVGLGATTLRWR